MTSSYDRAITVFSPDGHLLQVEYAMKAVEKGSSVVAIRSAEAVVMAVERRSAAKLQDPRTVKKIVQVDSHVTLAFAGLNADARVLIDRARVSCQSYRLTFEDAAPIETVARSIAEVQQKYTRSGGRRPFGITTFLAGFDADGSAQLWRTRPAGTHDAWKANATGRQAKTLRGFLEKKYEDGISAEEAIKLAVLTLLEVVESGAQNIEIAVVRKTGVENLERAAIEAIVKQLEAEKEESKGEKEDSK